MSATVIDKDEMFERDGNGNLVCVLCGKFIARTGRRGNNAMARTSHGRAHVRKGEAIEASVRYVFHNIGFKVAR